MKRRDFIEIEPENVRRFESGQSPGELRPGDFILTHGTSWTSKLIRLGQAIRIHGYDARYTMWNHAALVVNADGAIVEALGSGVCRRNLSEYLGMEYHLVCIKASHEDREEAAVFAQACVGQPYGWLTIASIACSLLTGAKLSFGFDGTQICSGLVASAMERTPAIFNRDSSHMMPADLAKYYKVDPSRTDS